jgi:hypothetical protein
MNHRAMGERGHHGTQKPLWQSEKQGTLKQGQEGKKGRILKEGQVPALKTFHTPTLGQRAPKSIHAESNPLNVLQT